MVVRALPVHTIVTIGVALCLLTGPLTTGMTMTHTYPHTIGMLGWKTTGFMLVHNYVDVLLYQERFLLQYL